MSLKNCFAYLSDKKCACLSEMKFYGSNKCCFYKTKQQLQLEEERTQRRLNK